MVEIKGIEKFASKDFPGHLASTVFLAGCNFSCPFCHNSDLVLRPEILPTHPTEDFINYLDSRKGWLEGICISGGEPLLHEDLEMLLRLIKDRALLVRIDTNGSFPSRLDALIKKQLVDNIAMDIKAPLEKYHEVTRSRVSVEDIADSIDVVKNSGLEYIFRTTVVPDLIDAKDIEEISKMLNGSKVFQIQQFVPANTIDSDFLKKRPYTRDVIEEFARIAENHFSKVKIEGI